MNNLLKADFYKLSKNKGVIVCLILDVIYAVLSTSALSILVKLSQIKGDATEGLSGMSIMTGGLQMGVVVALFVAVAITFYTTYDFIYGTAKHPISKGYDRIEVYFSDLITVSALASIMLLGYVLFSTLTATLLWGFGDFNLDVLVGSLVIVGVQIMLYISLAALTFMISMIFKNSGGAIAFNILMLTVFAGLLCNAINHVAGEMFDSNIYWIMNNMTMIIDPMTGNADILRGILVSVGYFTVSTIVGCIVIDKYEYK